MPQTMMQASVVLVFRTIWYDGDRYIHIPSSEASHVSTHVGLNAGGKPMSKWLTAFWKDSSLNLVVTSKDLN